MEYNTTIISIEPDRDQVTDFLELDENIFNEILQLSNKKLIGIQNDYMNNDKIIIEGIFL